MKILILLLLFINQLRANSFAIVDSLLKVEIIRGNSLEKEGTGFFVSNSGEFLTAYELAKDFVKYPSLYDMRVINSKGKELTNGNVEIGTCDVEKGICNFRVNYGTQAAWNPYTKVKTAEFKIDNKAYSLNGEKMSMHKFSADYTIKINNTKRHVIEKDLPPEAIGSPVIGEDKKLKGMLGYERYSKKHYVIELEDINKMVSSSRSFKSKKYYLSRNGFNQRKKIVKPMNSLNMQNVPNINPYKASKDEIKKIIEMFNMKSSSSSDQLSKMMSRISSMQKSIQMAAKSALQKGRPQNVHPKDDKRFKGKMNNMSEASKELSKVHKEISDKKGEFDDEVKTLDELMAQKVKLEQRKEMIGTSMKIKKKKMQLVKEKLECNCLNKGEEIQAKFEKENLQRELGNKKTKSEEIDKALAKLGELIEKKKEKIGNIQDELNQKEGEAAKYQKEIGNMQKSIPTLNGDVYF